MLGNYIKLYYFNNYSYSQIYNSIFNRSEYNFFLAS